MLRTLKDFEPQRVGVPQLAEGGMNIVKCSATVSADNESCLIDMTQGRGNYVVTPALPKFNGDRMGFNVYCGDDRFKKKNTCTVAPVLYQADYKELSKRNNSLIGENYETVVKCDMKICSGNVLNTAEYVQDCGDKVLDADKGKYLCIDIPSGIDDILNGYFKIDTTGKKYLIGCAEIRIPSQGYSAFIERYDRENGKLYCPIYTDDSIYYDNNTEPESSISKGDNFEIYASYLQDVPHAFYLDWETPSIIPKSEFSDGKLLLSADYSGLNVKWYSWKIYQPQGEQNYTMPRRYSGKNLEESVYAPYIFNYIVTVTVCDNYGRVHTASINCTPPTVTEVSGEEFNAFDDDNNGCVISGSGYFSSLSVFALDEHYRFRTVGNIDFPVTDFQMIDVCADCEKTFDYYIQDNSENRYCEITNMFHVQNCLSITKLTEKGEHMYSCGETFCLYSADNDFNANLNRRENILQTSNLPICIQGENYYHSGSYTADLFDVSGREITDTAKRIQEWEKFISSDSSFLLRNTKGEMFIAAITGNNSRTVNGETLLTTVTFEWTETDDIENCIVSGQLNYIPLPEVTP